MEGRRDLRHSAELLIPAFQRLRPGRGAVRGGDQRAVGDQPLRRSQFHFQLSVRFQEPLFRRAGLFQRQGRAGRFPLAHQFRARRRQPTADHRPGARRRRRPYPLQHGARHHRQPYLAIPDRYLQEGACPRPGRPCGHSFRRRLFADVAGGRGAAALRMAGRHARGAAEHVVSPAFQFRPGAGALSRLQALVAAQCPRRTDILDQPPPRRHPDRLRRRASESAPIVRRCARQARTDPAHGRCLRRGGRQPAAAGGLMLRALRFGLRRRTPSPQRGEGWGEGAPTARPELPLPQGQREKWALWLALIIHLATANFARAETIADIASLSGPDRTQRLIDGAKKEGVVSLYSSAVTDDSNAIAIAFEKKYGVKVQLWRGSSEDILRRAVTEARGGRYDVDVAETAGTEMEGLEREKLLAEISSPVFAQLVPQAVVPHRGWVTDRLSIFTAAYNTSLIHPADVPKSYEDLLDPKWKGKLGIEADDANWFMAVADLMGEAKALALFRKIAATNGMSLRKGHTLLANLVVAGEVPLGLTVYGYRVTELKRRAAPIDGVVLPPGLALPTGI